jgi:hypothetical protein
MLLRKRDFRFAMRKIAIALSLESGCLSSRGACRKIRVAMRKNRDGAILETPLTCAFE